MSDKQDEKGGSYDPIEVGGVALDPAEYFQCPSPYTDDGLAHLAEAPGIESVTACTKDAVGPSLRVTAEDLRTVFAEAFAELGVSR